MTARKKPDAPKRRGPKPWEPTAAQLAKIRSLASVGVTQADIAKVIGVGLSTLQRNEKIRPVLEIGKIETIEKVAGKLVTEAVNGNMTAAIFYLKAQAGWSERQTVRHEDHEGNPIRFNAENLKDEIRGMSQQERDAIEQALRLILTHAVGSGAGSNTGDSPTIQ